MTTHSSSRSLPWSAAVVLLLAGLVLPARGWAMEHAPCADPIVFPGTSVHVFILPYAAARPLSAEAASLVTALQRHVLFTALKYSSIAVAELVADHEGGECSADRVMAIVGKKLRPDQAAVFMGGRMFEQQGTVYLESWIRVPEAAGRGATWHFAVGGTGEVSARIPVDPVTFAPRAIPLGMLDTLESVQRELGHVHKLPDPGSLFWKLPSGPHDRVGLIVLGTQADWMHVKRLPSGEEGWIAAHHLMHGDELKGMFPELYFIDGLIGYELLAGAASAPMNIGGRPLAEYVRASFGRYVAATRGGPETDARAIASVLQGNASLAANGSGPWSGSVLETAQSDYSSARQLAPTSTIASSFYLAATTALCSQGKCPGGGAALHAAYLAAIGRDPTSRELLENLGILYRAAETGQLALGLDDQALVAQRARLNLAIGDAH